MEFGAFVNLVGARDGFLHISEIANEKTADINDALTEGNQVWVKVIGYDQRGKVKLSMKVVNQETGENLAEDVEVKPKNTSDKPNRESKSGNGNRRSSSPRKEKEAEPQAKTEKRKYFS
jgi:polyribonucleotide nucleotidyltransferase